MGVTGLWALLEPTSTQIDLSSLQGKILAIGNFKLWLFSWILFIVSYHFASPFNVFDLNLRC